jgi:hemin uptake protein HemP
MSVVSLDQTGQIPDWASASGPYLGPTGLLAIGHDGAIYFGAVS